MSNTINLSQVAAVDTVAKKGLWVAPPWVIRMLANAFRRSPERAEELLSKLLGFPFMSGKALILPDVDTFPFPIGDGKKEFRAVPREEFFASAEGIVLLPKDDYWSLLKAGGQKWSEPFQKWLKATRPTQKRRSHKPKTPEELAEAAARLAEAKKSKAEKRERDRELRARMKGAAGGQRKAS